MLLVFHYLSPLLVGLAEMIDVRDIQYHHRYPAVILSTLIASTFTIIFSPHTYLFGPLVIKQTSRHDSSPALHNAAASVIELSSDISLEQFLMVYIAFVRFFSLMPWSCAMG